MYSNEQDLQTLAGVNTRSGVPMDGMNEELVTIAGIGFALFAFLGGEAVITDKHLNNCEDKELSDWFTCAKAETPSAVTELGSHVIQSGASAVIPAAMPAGSIKNILSGASTLSDLDTANQVIGIKKNCEVDINELHNQRGGGTTAPLAFDSNTDAGYYVGTSNDGSFNDVPEGEWAMVTFNPDMAQFESVCVAVTPGETTEITITPIAFTDMDSATGGSSTVGSDTGGYTDVGSGKRIQRPIQVTVLTSARQQLPGLVVPMVRAHLPYHGR